jgi:hypothetical protein
LGNRLHRPDLIKFQACFAYFTPDNATPSRDATCIHRQTQSVRKIDRVRNLDTCASVSQITHNAISKSVLAKQKLATFEYSCASAFAAFIHFGSAFKKDQK